MRKRNFSISETFARNTLKVDKMILKGTFMKQLVKTDPPLDFNLVHKES